MTKKVPWQEENGLKRRVSARAVLSKALIALHHEYLNWKGITESICRGNDYIRGYRDGLRRSIAIMKEEIDEYDDLYRSK